MQKNGFPSINSGFLTVVPIICRNFAVRTNNNQKTETYETEKATLRHHHNRVPVSGVHLVPQGRENRHEAFWRVGRLLGHVLSGCGGEPVRLLQEFRGVLP